MVQVRRAQATWTNPSSQVFRLGWKMMEVPKRWGCGVRGMAVNEGFVFVLLALGVNCVS